MAGTSVSQSTTRHVVPSREDGHLILDLLLEVGQKRFVDPAQDAVEPILDIVEVVEEGFGKDHQKRGGNPVTTDIADA